MPNGVDYSPWPHREVTLLPFRALRHRAPFAEVEPLLMPLGGEIDKFSDVVAARDPRHMVHAIAPERRPDDRSPFVRWARASACLARWRREGVLVPDDEPALYGWQGAVYGLVRLDACDNAATRPSDPLRRLEATLTHAEPVSFISVAPLPYVEEEEGPQPISKEPLKLTASWPHDHPLLLAAEAFAGDRAADPNDPAAYVLAAALDMGERMIPPPAGAILWSHADYSRP